MLVYLYSLLGAASLSVCMTLVKLSAKASCVLTILYYRSIWGVIISLLLFFIFGKSKLTFSKFHLHILRSMIICIGMICTYISYRVLPMSVATCISMSTPIFTSTLSYFLLSEKNNNLEKLMLLFGYIGVLIIIYPIIKLHEFNIYVIGALLANICSSIGIILLKKLTLDNSYYHILLVQNMFNILFFAIANNSIKVRIDQTFGMVLAISLTALISQIFLSKAVSISSVNYVISFDYMRFIFTCIIGIVYFQEFINLRIICGICTVVSSNIIFTASKNFSIKT